ncbi:MAG: hypothetical protein R3E96_03675 [Planctomycetota bacterium]
MAARFGAHTSGAVVLYSEEGRLQFQGGVTAARAHEGDNLGRESLLSLYGGSGQVVAHTPVFGCPLQGGSCECCREWEASP